MTTNSVIIKNFIEDVIKVCSEVTSNDYMKVIIKEMIAQKMEPNVFLHYINIEEKVEVDAKLDNYDKATLLKPLNQIFDFLLFNHTKKLFLETVSKEKVEEYEEFGFKIKEPHF